MSKKYTGENYPWTNYMTLEEWKLFVENYNIQKRDKHYKLKEHLLKFDNNFEEFIMSAFLWDTAIPNTIYWIEISDRTKPVVK